jgi:hypothetical protein
VFEHYSSPSQVPSEDLFMQAVLPLQAVERKFESIGNADLVINLIQVVLDDLLGGTELMGYLLVAHAQRDAGDDL